MNKTRLGACLMVAVSMSALSCDDDRLGGCSLVGCLDHLRIDLASPPRLPYEVTLQFPDGLIVPFPCHDDKTRSVGDYLFRVACRTDAFELVCDINPGYCSPPSLSVELKLPDGTRRSGTLTPEYHRDQPNGLGCEPTCSSGLATLQ